MSARRLFDDDPRGQCRGSTRGRPKEAIAVEATHDRGRRANGSWVWPRADAPTGAGCELVSRARPTPHRAGDTRAAERAGCSPRSRDRRTPPRRPRRCTSRRRRRATVRARARASAGPLRARARRSLPRSGERDREPSSACAGRAVPGRQLPALARATFPRSLQPQRRPGAAAPRSRILPVDALEGPRSATRPRRRGVVRRGRRRPRTVSASCAASAD